MKRYPSCLMPVLLIALSGLFFQSCSQKPPEKMVQAAMETTTPASDTPAKQTTGLSKNKTAQTSAGKAEENYKNRSQEFPADFPLPKYPGSALELSNLDLGRPTQTILLTTSDSPDKVFDYYCQQLKKSGWMLGDVYKTTGCLIMSSAKKGSQSKITITETRGGQTGISLSISKQ